MVISAKLPARTPSEADAPSRDRAEPCAPPKALPEPATWVEERERLLELLKPLMEMCARTGVLWELTPEPVKIPRILLKANEMGVRFTATADAHHIDPGGWSNLAFHLDAEQYLDSLGLHKGTIQKA